MEIKIEALWKEALKNEFDKPYFQQIVFFLKPVKATGKIIYPQGALLISINKCYVQLKTINSF